MNNFRLTDILFFREFLIQYVVVDCYLLDFKNELLLKNNYLSVNKTGLYIFSLDEACINFYSSSTSPETFDKPEYITNIFI